MGILTAVLENARLLRPWVALAQLSPESVTALLQGAAWYRGLMQVLHGLSGLLAPARVRLPLAWFDQALLGGVILLLCGLTVLDTGPIGVMVWGLFFLHLSGQVLHGFPACRRVTVTDVLVGLFVLSAGVSTAFSSYQPASLVGLGKLLTFFAGYAVFRGVIQGADPGGALRRVMLLLGVLVALCAGEAMIGFYQYLNHVQPLATWEDPSINPELKMTRIFGTLKPSNPNLLAGFLTSGLAAALGFSLWGGFARRRSLWIPAVALTLIILLALVLTGSRGGFLAIAATFIATFAVAGHLIWHDGALKRQPELKKAWVGLLLVALLLPLGAIGASPQLQHRVASIFAMREDSSSSYRLNVYQSALQMAQDNPWVGIGPGNDTFKQVYGLYMVPGYNALGAYSVPLEIAVEQGLPGLLLFLLLLATLFLKTAFYLDAPRPDWPRKILVGLLCTGVLASFVYGFFDTIWYRPPVNLVFWLLVAALSAVVDETPSGRHLA